MTAPLVFLDTETTGVHPERELWEFAAIRREPDGSEQQMVFQIIDVDLSKADPFGLKVGRFYERHVSYGGQPGGPWTRLGGRMEVVHADTAASMIETITRGAHVVGLVPSFDTDTLDPLLRKHGKLPAWHYHLIDVENMALGYLAAKGKRVEPPTESDELTRLCGIEPPSDEDRHTAFGDARWVLEWYDAIMKG